MCQYLVAGRWLSSGTPVSSTNKTDHHDIAEIFLTVALNTITALILAFYVGLIPKGTLGVIVICYAMHSITASIRGDR